MNFDDIQKLWQQQEDKTVFSINDFVLRDVLARKRQEFSKKFLVRQLLTYVAGTIVMLWVSFLFLVMLVDDKPNTVSHYASVVLTWAVVLFWVTWTWAWVRGKRKRLAERQYTGSVKDEIARSITELDFEIALRTDVPKLLAAYVPLPLSSLLLVWAIYSVNTDAADQMLYIMCFAIFSSVYIGFKSAQQDVVAYFLPRKQELEQLRAKLGE